MLTAGPGCGAGRMDLVLGDEVAPPGERAEHRGRVVIDLAAEFLVVVAAAIGHGQGFHHPAAIVVGAGDLEAPAGHLVALALGQLLGPVGQLGPGLRRLARIEAGFLGVIGVDVEQRRRILERHAVDRTVDHGVALQRRKELAEKLRLGGAISDDQRVEIGQLVLDLHVEQEVGGHDHGGGRLAGLDRGARLDQRVVIRAGIDGGRLDVGMAVVELLDQGAHVAGELAVDGDGKEQVDLGRALLGEGGKGESPGHDEAEREPAGKQHLQSPI